MGYIQKIYVNYKDCSSQRELTLPCILTEKGIIISHLRFLAEYNYKSGSWKERSCYALELLLKYINAIPHIKNATKLLKAFTEALATGTINYTNYKDPLNLYWRPRTLRDTNDLLFHITFYTDFLSKQDQYSSIRVNPFRKATSHEERLNWCAYYNKEKHVFLSHLTDDNHMLDQIRVVAPYNENLVEHEYAVRFPEDQFEKLLFLGFKNDEKNDFKSQAITMLMNYGGLRKSEIFHIYTCDITLIERRDKNKIGSPKIREAQVRVYHPELGASPDPNYRNRREYLLATTSYQPRNKYLISERLFSGWKSPKLTSKENYFEVLFNPLEKAQEFLIIWMNYLKFQRVEPPANKPHPFAFTNNCGAPETIKNFQRLHKNAVERIGLSCKKSLGTTEHGHRHAYGYRGLKSGLSPIELQTAMHHKSPFSSLVYTKPTEEEVKDKLSKIK